MKKIISFIAALFIITVLPAAVMADDISLSAPNISVSSSPSSGSATFTLKTDSSKATIYYTLNGTDPTRSSSRYSRSVKVTQTCEVRAVAYYDGEYSDVGYYLVTVTLPRVSEPVLKSTSVEAGKKITITCPSATIYYTTDGTEPSSSNGTRYSSSGIIVSESCTIKAIGVRKNYKDSPVATGFVDIPKVGRPSYSTTSVSNGTRVKLSGPGSGCTYYYTTNGSTPTPKTSSSCKKYSSSGITVNRACTIKLIACKKGYEPSSVYAIEISGPRCAAPEASKKAVVGGYNVKLTCDTSGAYIYYTTDGSMPSTSDKRYTSSGIIIDQEGTTVIYAMAVKNGYENSPVAGFSVSLNQLPKPSASYVSSSSTTSRKVRLKGTSGSTIYYTLNGNTPTTSSTRVSSGSTITIRSSCTLKAFAAKPGYAPSEEFTAPLKVEKTVATPTASMRTYPKYVRATLKVSTSGAKIYYTTNGRDPFEYGKTCSSGSYIDIEESTILKIGARKSGYEDSDVASYRVNVGSGNVTILGLDEEDYSTSVYRNNDDEEDDEDYDIDPDSDGDIPDQGEADPVKGDSFPDVSTAETKLEGSLTTDETVERTIGEDEFLLEMGTY